jgi:hypothetical protein
MARVPPAAPVPLSVQLSELRATANHGGPQAFIGSRGHILPWVRCPSALSRSFLPAFFNAFLSLTNKFDVIEHTIIMKAQDVGFLTR